MSRVEVDSGEDLLVRNDSIDNIEAEWPWAADTAPSQAGWGTPEAEWAWTWGSRHDRRGGGREEQGDGAHQRQSGRGRQMRGRGKQVGASRTTHDNEVEWGARLMW
jgi:hypothetical protein